MATIESGKDSEPARHLHHESAEPLVLERQTGGIRARDSRTTVSERRLVTDQALVCSIVVNSNAIDVALGLRSLHPTAAHQNTSADAKKHVCWST